MLSLTGLPTELRQHILEYVPDWTNVSATCWLLRTDVLDDWMIQRKIRAHYFCPVVLESLRLAPPGIVAAFLGRSDQRCEGCLRKSLFRRPHALDKVWLCHGCSRSERFALVTKTAALREHKVKPAELDKLDFKLKGNPHYRGAPPMRLYRLAEVLKLEKVPQRKGRKTALVEVT
jgi:hypothetical protein